MVRYKYVNNVILKLFECYSPNIFPVDIIGIINKMPNCKVLSYQKFASINNCSISYVEDICESVSGCTHYDSENDRYLILFNTASENIVSGNVLWTLAHELGHVMLCHAPMIASSYSYISDEVFKNYYSKNLEYEADYFAATLLSPFPLFDYCKVKSAWDTAKVFGLSEQVAFYRWNQFLIWKNFHYKTSWEKDLKNTVCSIVFDI